MAEGSSHFITSNLLDLSKWQQLTPNPTSTCQQSLSIVSTACGSTPRQLCPALWLPPPSSGLHPATNILVCWLCKGPDSVASGCIRFSSSKGSAQFLYRYLTLDFPFPHGLLTPGAARFCSAGKEHPSQDSSASWPGAGTYTLLIHQPGANSPLQLADSTVLNGSCPPGLNGKMLRISSCMNLSEKQILSELRLQKTSNLLKQLHLSV